MDHGRNGVRASCFLRFEVKHELDELQWLDAFESLRCVVFGGRTLGVKCEHCGVEFRPSVEGERFCCSGCEIAWKSNEAKGFGRFYSLKRETTPLRGSAMAKRDFRELGEWLTARELEADHGIAGGELELRGVSCSGCVWLIERIFRSAVGVGEIVVNAQAGRVRLKWSVGAFPIERFASELAENGYSLGLVEPGERHEAESSQLVTHIGLSGFLALNTMLFTLPRYLGIDDSDPLAPFLEAFAAFFATASVFLCGRYFVARACRGLRHGVLHIDFPIALGIVSAWFGSVAGWLLGEASLQYFDFLGVFIFLMLAGRWVQESAVERNRRRVLSGVQLCETATVIRRDGTERVSLRELKTGVRLRIGPGDFVPVLSRVADDGGVVSLEWINGESEPRSLDGGRLVAAGAVNIGGGTFEVIAHEDWGSSTLMRLMQVEESDFRDPLLERVLRHYLTVVVAIALAGFGFWWCFGGVVTALQVMVSVLVVSCPCSLGVAGPLTKELAISRLRRVGVFVKVPDVFRRLGGVRQIVFDKTGTLTFENPRLLNPESLDSLSQEALQALSLMVNNSLHPISRSLRETLLVRGAGKLAPGVAACAVEELPGVGLSVEVDDESWTLGRPGWSALENCRTEVDVDCELRRSGVRVAAFRFEDAVRDGAVESLRRLESRGLKIAILSGDRSAKVQRLATALGLGSEVAFGEMTPEAKADWVRSCSHGRVLMVGDGLNDALAFDAAWVRGTPVVDKGLLEPRSDFFFLDRGLEGIECLFEASAWHERSLGRVFVFAVIYNCLAVGACLASLMNPLVAAILMPLSSVVTVLLASMGRPLGPTRGCLQ